MNNAKTNKAYLVEKVTIVRAKDDSNRELSFNPDDIVVDLKQYKEHLRAKFGVTRVYLTYSEIDETMINSN